MPGQEGNFRINLPVKERRADRDAAVALDRHLIRARPPPRALTSPANWIAPPNSRNFSVKVVLPASGCEITATGRTRLTPRISLDIIFADV
jgi:hypothetical protein